MGAASTAGTSKRKRQIHLYFSKRTSVLCLVTLYEVGEEESLVTQSYVKFFGKWYRNGAVMAHLPEWTRAITAVKL